MKKLIPILLLLSALAGYVYFERILPSREYDPVVRGSGAIEATEVVVSAKIPARVLEIRAGEGDAVKAGQVLVVLQCDEPLARKSQALAALAQARALGAQARAAEQLARAQTAPLAVQKDYAAKEHNRAVDLLKSAAGTERVADKAEAALKTVTEQRKAAELAVHVAGHAVKVADAQAVVAEKNLALAQTQVDECALKAPLDGVVMAKNREVGELVLPGASLMKLGRLDEVHTWIYVPNEELGRVKLGRKVKIRADTYPDREFAGAISRINEEAEFTPKSIQTKEDRTRLVYGVKVTIPNPDRALLPGMPVEAEVLNSAGGNPGP